MSELEYLEFFDRWIKRQFPRDDDAQNNSVVLNKVAQIVSDADELAHWTNRDCWSMFDYARGE
jgi:hypothetical protein